MPDGRLADEQGGQFGWAFQSTLYNQPRERRGLGAPLVGERRTATRRQHVFIRFLLYRTSVHRVITSSLLLLSHTWVSEAQDSLWHKKEVARISLRRIQACQQRSLRSPCRIVTFFFYYLLTGTFRSFPLERFQAPREKESFVIDSVFVPIPNFQTQEVDAIQLRLAYDAVSPRTV